MLYFHSLEETEKRFIRLREFGFTCCQINSWEHQKWTNENADGIRALAGSCTVEVSDDQLAANYERFTITGDGEVLTVSRTENEPDLRCTINGLSALAMERCLSILMQTKVHA